MFLAYLWEKSIIIVRNKGRIAVIRTEKDKGSILLVDSRYLSKKYKDMLPPAWKVESDRKSTRLNSSHAT